jgi:hypothetical protein
MRATRALRTQLRIAHVRDQSPWPASHTQGAEVEGGSNAEAVEAQRGRKRKGEGLRRRWWRASALEKKPCELSFCSQDLTLMKFC